MTGVTRQPNFTYLTMQWWNMQMQKQQLMASLNSSGDVSRTTKPENQLQALSPRRVSRKPAPSLWRLGLPSDFLCEHAHRDSQQLQDHRWKVGQVINQYDPQVLTTARKLIFLPPTSPSTQSLHTSGDCSNPYFGPPTIHLIPSDDMLLCPGAIGHTKLNFRFPRLAREGSV